MPRNTETHRVTDAVTEVVNWTMLFSDEES